MLLWIGGMETVSGSHFIRPLRHLVGLDTSRLTLIAVGWIASKELLSGQGLFGYIICGY
jgi:hypothetical protein